MDERRIVPLTREQEQTINRAGYYTRLVSEIHNNNDYNGYFILFNNNSGRANYRIEPFAIGARFPYLDSYFCNYDEVLEFIVTKRINGDTR